jgi:citrate lyase subunit beta/citryl-CoA lyase
VESAAAVAAVAARCRVELHPVVESALGLERAYAIATAHRAVAGISLGEADLRSELGLVGDDGLAWPRGRIVVAARAAGLPAPVMSVYPHVSDPSGLDASTREGRPLGFVGRSAIHPRQLPVIVAAFRPAAEEVDRANALLAAVAAGEEVGSGVVVLPDGRFADRAMVAAARATVDLEAHTRVRPAD